MLQQVPAVFNFITTFLYLMTVIAPLCIALGICGWLSEHVRIGGPRR